jgi:hypothetical protein
MIVAMAGIIAWFVASAASAEEVFQWSEQAGGKLA